MSTRSKRHSAHVLQSPTKGLFSMRKIFLSIVLITLILGAGSASAQSKNGTIRGTIRDSSRALIPGVQLTLIDVETRVAITTQTNGRGEYKFENVPGIYELTAKLPGFRTLKIPDLRLNENEIRRDLTLMIAPPGLPLDFPDVRWIPLIGRS
jgi:hypothetical protein